MSDKDYNLQVRLSGAERAAFEDAARVAGLSISAWVRDRLRRTAREELQSAGIKVPFIEEIRTPHE
jgi:hypothetical protein